jgi:hypothetical protein
MKGCDNGTTQEVMVIQGGVIRELSEITTFNEKRPIAKIKF